MDTTTTTTSSICNDILTYLTSNHHSTFPLNPINVQTSAASDSLFSYSPTTLHSSDLISDAYKSLWSPKQSEVGKVAVRDGSSSEEVSCGLLTQSDQETVGRYKTELCRPFEENGFCKYGNRCQFAHGRQELRDVDRHPKYKTQLCKTFHTTGICRYGKRCHFIHNEDEGNKTQRQSPQQQQQQQQQHPVSGLRKLTGRQNTKSADDEEQQQQQQQQPFQAYSIFPTQSVSSISSSTSRYFEEQTSPVVSSRMSLPSSTSSSPSPSLASFNDDAFFQPSSLFSAAANDSISQMPPICWRKTSTSPSFSSLPGSIDLFSHPLSVRPTMPTESSSSSSSSSFFSAPVQQKGISSSSSSSRGDEDQESCRREVVDLILRNLNKSQMQLLVEHLLFQTQTRNASI